MCKASVCASTWRPEDNLKCILRNAVHFFGHSVSHCPGAHQLGKPGWLASLSDPSLSTSTALGLQAHTTTPDIFMWARGIRFRSTGLTNVISLSLSSRSANQAPHSERLELLCLQNGPALAEMSPLRLKRAGSLSSSLFGAMYSQSVLGQQPMEKYHIGMYALSLLPPSASLLLFPSILSPDHQSLLLRLLTLPHSLL